MIRLFFGKPGCGKTTMLVKLAVKNPYKAAQRYLNFSNDVIGASPCDLDGLGEWTFPWDSHILVDESGIEFNSRAYKALPKPFIKWIKTYRHYGCNIDFASQSWEDTDVTIRRLTDQLWYMYRLGPWTLCRRVYKRVTVDKNTEQIIDGYRMAHALWLPFWFLQLGWPFTKKWMLTYRPFYYKYFDSWERDNSLPVRPFPVNTERKQKNYFVAFKTWIKGVFPK